MMRKIVLLTVIGTILAALPLLAQLEQVGEAPNHALTADLTLAQVQNALASGDPALIKQVRQAGLLVFSTPFNNFDGHGDGPFANELPNHAFGKRPTLQGNGQFLRINGLDAQACNECHVVVKNSTLPPTLGLAGVGTVAESALPLVNLADIADSQDDRVAYHSGHDPDLPLVWDGVADFSGRFINPPFLFGGGGVELLGKEMTYELQGLLDAALAAPAGTVVSLDTHGTHFGTLTSVDADHVEVDLEGIGPHDLSGVVTKEEASAALVVRPFGRKGDNFSMRDFDRGAMQFHFGIQPVEVLVAAGLDPDDDGDDVENEVTVGEMSALHVFDVTNPRPVREPLDAQAQIGAQLFVDVGCASCHHPQKTTLVKKLPLAHPEVPEDPTANVYALIDLVEVGFQPSGSGGVVVPLFADLKRHDMGPALAETCELCFDEGQQASNAQFTTARLWGIADTAPYLHDGRATTLRKAIDFHGGEAQTVRDDYFALPELDQARILHFLRHLRTPDDPNEELRP